MTLRLVCLENAPEKSIDLLHGPVVVGRADDADIKIVDRFASRKHCVIENVGGEIYVSDLKSRHGTWVNGQQVDKVPLHEGDILSIGLSKFRAETEEDDAPLISKPTS